MQLQWRRIRRIADEVCDDIVRRCGDGPVNASEPEGEGGSEREARDASCPPSRRSAVAGEHGTHLVCHESDAERVRLQGHSNELFVTHWRTARLFCERNVTP